MWYAFNYIQELSLTFTALMRIRHNRKRIFLSVIRSEQAGYSVITINNSPKKMSRVYEISLMLDSENKCYFLSVDLEATLQVVINEQNGWSKEYSSSKIQQFTNDILLEFCEEKSIALQLIWAPHFRYDISGQLFEYLQRMHGTNIYPTVIDSLNRTLDWEVNYQFKSIPDVIIKKFSITTHDLYELISPAYNLDTYKGYVDTCL